MFPESIFSFKHGVRNFPTILIIFAGRGVDWGTSGATTKWGAAGNRATSGVEIKGADTPAVRTGEATVGKKETPPHQKAQNV